jgi:hypothetical protein
MTAASEPERNRGQRDHGHILLGELAPTGQLAYNRPDVGDKPVMLGRLKQRDASGTVHPSAKCGQNL